MKPTKKMNKMWAIIIVILGTLIMPFKVASNTNQAPTITFGQMGGEVLKQSDEFITNSNPKGYGTVPVTATDPEGDGVERFEYMWDWYILDTVEIVKPRWTTMKPTRTYAVQVPQQPGLHTLRIRAIDEHGNASDWIAVPYYIVDKLSATPDTTGPVIDTNSLPAEGTALELGSTVSIKASDAESGVYYIAHAWKKAGMGTPSSSEYTRVFQPVNGTVKNVQVPTTIGKWTLYTFGGNSTYNQQTELFITGSKYTPTYEIVNTSELKESIKTVENAKYEQANYTTNSWNTYAAALNTAKTVANSSTRTQVQINDAKATLESAVNGLVDISALKASIKTVEDANYQQENYSTDSWNFYKTALEVAKTVVASEDATQTQVDGARIGLEEAVKGLTTDKTELQAAITEADKLKAANFTEGSFSIFTSALNTAKSVAGNANATQLEINNAKIALEEAVNGLVDISALKASLETAGTKVQEEYSTASWEAFITKKEAAQEVLDNASATKEQVADAKAALDNAMSNLTVDKTDLEAIIAEANEKVAENFTRTSYEALIQAKVGAEDLTKQNEIDSKVTEIRNAIDALVDISGLKASLETAGTKVQEEYSIASWEAFTTAKEAAQEVLDNASATKEQVAEAKTELDNAMSNLTVDKTALTDILAEANGKVAENFTQTSYEALTQAKVGAEDLTKQSEIDSKVAEIRNAIDALVDISGLKASLETAGTKVQEEYSTASWETFITKKEAAEAVIANPSATKGQVAEAKTELDNAMTALTTDKTDLEAVIAEAAKKNEADYSEETWTIFVQEKTAAEAILAKNDATQKEIDDAKAALETAMAGLTTSRAGLENAIKEAEKDEYSEANKDNYTLDSYTVYSEALTAAKSVLADETATQTQINKAKEDLEQAVKSLVSIKELKDSITAATSEEINAADYSTESYEAYVDALAEARRIVSKTDATEKEVNDAKIALDAAFEGLTFDNTALLELIAEAEKIAGDNYTKGSYKTLSDALNGAKELTKQSEIDARLEAIQDAIDNLVDISALKTAMDTANGKQEADYSETTWGPFEAARTAAQGVLENENATQNEVDTVLATLNDTMAALATDTSVLDKVIQDAEKLNAADYTKITHDALKAKIEVAKLVLENENATQSELNAQVTEIQNAVKALVNISALKTSLNTANEKVEADYSEATWGPFEEARTAAQSVLDNENATQNEVDTALATLTEKMNALDVDKTALNKAIEDAGKLNADDYTKGSYAVLEEKLDGAEALTKQSDIDTRVDEINAAINALVNIKELKEVVAVATGKNESDYSEETWTTFEQAKVKAETILAKNNATQDEVDAAKTELQTAMDALKADKKALTDIIAEAKALENTKTDYTAGSYAKVIEALVGADELANDPNASQEDINNKVKEIRDAIDNLVDLTDLKAIIAIADKKVVEEQGDYSDKTWEAFLAEKSAAEAVRDNQNASKQDVQEAITNLQAAIENLKADNSELLAILEEVNEIVKNQDDYTSTTFEALMKTLEDINDLTKQSEIDAKVAEIRAAINALEKEKVDTSAVDNFVKSLVSTDYTNWTDFMKLVDDVKSEDLQSVFDSRVSEVIDFPLTAKEVDQTELDQYLATLLPSESYTNWDEFEQLVKDAQSVNDLQSKFDAKLKLVKAFKLEVKIITIDTSKVEFQTEFVYNGTDYEQNGTEQKVQLKTGTKLPEGLTIVDFGKGRTNAGTTQVTVTFGVTDSTKYALSEATRTLDLTIKPAPVEITADDFVTELTYNGQPQKVSLKDTVKLPKGIVITSNTTTRTNIGTTVGATVKFGYQEDYEEIKNYAVPAAVTGLSVTIKPATIEITADDFVTEVPYNGAAQTVQLTEEAKAKLPEEIIITDFGGTRENIGTKTGITVKFGYDKAYTGYKNYTVPAPVSGLSLTIKPAIIEITADDFVTEVLYNGAAQTVQLTEAAKAKLPEGIIITNYGGTRENVGTKTGITVKFGYDSKYTGYKNYAVPAPVSGLSLTIKPAPIPTPISKNDFITSFTYTGDEYKVQLKPEVTLPGGLTIVDFGEGRTDAGTTTGITVKFGYEDPNQQFKNYQVPANITGLSLTVNKANQENVTVSVNPTAIIVGQTAKISGNGIGEASYVSNNTNIATVDNKGIITAIKEGTAEITVTYAGDENHNPITVKATVTVAAKVLTGIKATYDNTTPVEAGTTLADIKSSVTVKAVYNDGSKATVTDFELEGTLVAGQDNTITVKVENKETTITVTVNKIKIDVSTVEFQTEFVYNGTNYEHNGTEQKVQLKPEYTLPTGLTITDYGKGRINVGTTEGITVTFGVTDPEVYELSATTRTLSITIKPAPVEITADDFVKELTYNGEYQHIQLKDEVILPQGIIVTDFGGTRLNKGTKTGVTVKFGYDADFTGHKNYAVPANISGLSFTIKPATVNISASDFDTVFDYDGTEHKVQLKDGVTLPGGLIVTDFGEGRTNAGTTPVTVTFGYAEKPDFENYIVPNPITLDLTVNKIAQNASITLNPSTIIVGKTATITGNGEGVILSYQSSDESIATVVNGVVTGHKAGTATITVIYAGNENYNGAEATAVITVVDKSEPQEGEDKQYTIPTGLTAYAGEKLSTISLEGHNLVWVNPDEVMSADKTEYTAKFEETDEFVEKNVTITITVSKRQPDVTLPTGVEATYGDTLADVKLPDGWSFKAELTTSVGDAGNNEFDVIFTPEDTEIYETVDGKITIAVAQATPNYTLPTGLKAIYGQTLSEIALVDETADGTWRYRDDAETTTVGDAGANEFEVMFIPRDTKNYKTIRGQKVIIEVAQATPNYTLPTGLKATYGQTLADVTLPAVTAEEIEQGATAGQWTYVDAEETSVGNVGNREFEVVFTPEDAKNYKTITGLKVIIEVAKATPNYTLPTGLKTTYGKTLADVTLPAVTAEEIEQGATAGQWSYVDADETSVGNAGNNEFEVMFIPADQDNYEVVTGLKVTIEVAKARPSFTLPTGLKAIYGQTLANVALTQGWAYVDELTTSVGNAGNNEFAVIFTPADTNNYEIVTDQKVTIEVAKATPEYTLPTGLKATYGQTLADVPLTQGWTYVANSETLVGAAGNNEFEVVFTPNDTDNYNTVTGLKVTIEVAKATPEYTLPTDLKAIYGQTLADVPLPDERWEYVLDDSTSVGNAGNNEFDVTFTPEDTHNYKKLNLTVTIEVAKATPEYTLPTGLTATYGKTLADVELTTGWSYVDPLTTKVGTVGNNEFEVRFTPNDTENYEEVTGLKVTIAVTKAIPEYTLPTGLTTTYGKTLADVELTTGWSYVDPLTTKVGTVGNNEFEVRFTPSDTENYEEVTGLKVTITVEKAIPEYELPTDLTATYGDKLETVGLPEGWRYSEDDPKTTTVGNAGNNEFAVMFIPKDQENYEVVTGLKVTIAVAKANPSYTLPTGVTATYGQTLAEVKLPEGWSFVDETESVGVVGDNEFDAIYTPSDTQNYNRVTGLKVTVKVEKAIPPYTLPTNLTATYGQTLADVKLPKGWKFTSVLTTPVGNVGDNEFAVVFTPDDTDNYEIVIGLKVIIKVGKAIPPYTLPENVTAIYGQTLGDITLGEGWTFADNAETPVGNVGTHEFEVIFTPEDTENYDTVTGLKVTITVSQAPSQFPELEEMHIAYDPTATVGSIKLPKVDKQGNALEGTLTFAEDEDQSAIIGGAVTNHYKVVYTPNDANYAPVEGTFTVIIGKAEQQPIDLSLVPERIDMEVTKQFTISIANEAELKGDKTFISSDSSILDIDEDGNVQVVGRGKVTITVIISGNANYQPVSATKEIIVVSGTKPTISLNGKEEVIVEVGNTYTDAGVIAYNNLGEDITNRVQTYNPVNTTVVGTYTITYNVTDASGNVADEVTRTVRVVDTQKPVITLEGQPEVIVEVGDTYTDAGAIANDNYDGVITEKIITVNPVDTTVVGTYTITYNVTDANGNKADEVTRTVRVVDTQKPVIKIDTLFQRLEAGSKYQRVEAQVTDNYDKNIEVTVDTSKLNMNKLGLYDVIYNAVDSSGNAAEPVTVKVQIIDTTAPTIEFANPADATQVYVRGGKYKVPQFITTDNAGNEDVTIVKSGIVDSSTPGKYTVEYYAVDKTGNKSEKLVVNVTVQNYPPIISYVRNDAINPIVEGEEYAYSLTVHFEGTGTLTTAEGTRTITSGETLSDGEYSLTATLPDGASSTVNFVINRMGPKVNLSNGVYLEAQTIIVERPEIIVRATLRDAQGKLISDDINVINGYTLNEKGVNTYSLVLEDNKGRTTILDSIIVYIAE